MEQMFKKFLSATALIGVACNVAAESVVTQFNIRPQSWNAARKVSGEVPGSKLTFLPDMDNYNGYFGLTLAYNRTFRPGAIAFSLFGDSFVNSTTTPTTNSCDNDCDNRCVIKIQGSDVVERDPKAWLADYFYLPSQFDGSISVSPRISNIVLDFNWYMGLDEWCPGLYFRLYGPFVNSKWSLGLEEATPTNAGSSVEAGKFTPLALAQADLLSSALSYFAGDRPTTPLTQASTALVPNAANFTTVRNGLCSSKMRGSNCNTTTTNTNCCDGDDNNKRRSSHSVNGFGELRAELGWNFWQCDDYHLGIGIQGAAPTGSEVCADYLFDAYVGNGKHWELGGLLTGHYIWWRSSCEDKHFGMYLDANLTHLFKANQERSFDLKGKPLSRYMLAARHNQVTNGGTNVLQGNTAPNTTANSTNSQYVFSGEFTPVANLTRQKVKVSVGVQADVAAWFNYTCGGFSWDLGYDYFGQSCEKIDCGSECPPALASQNTFWALKGDANVYGYQGTTQTSPTAFAAQALAVSESAATIQTGTNLAALVAANPTTASLAGPIDNAAVDKPQFAVGQAGGQGAAPLNWSAAASGPGNPQTRISLAPNFLGVSDINYEQKSRQSSNKIFTHVQYKWDRECWEPYIGFGGEAEFGQSKGRNCDTNTCNTTTNTCNTACDSCRNIAVSQWGVWFKTGVAFN